MANTTIKVSGMTCGGCVKSIENALNEQAGVLRVKANLDAGTVDIDFDAGAVQPTALEQIIEKAGFDVTT